MINEQKKLPAILTIAGSDPSGGAGIQADLKTFTILKTYGCAAITNLTVQNSLGVHSTHPVDPEIVFNQIQHVLADIHISHIKIGMLGNAETVKATAGALENFIGEVVYDPVISASAGQDLLSKDGVKFAKNTLGPFITVITPNLSELESLTGRICDSSAAALSAAEQLFVIFPHLKAAVIKGGHIAEDLPTVTDYLLIRGKSAAKNAIVANHQRISSTNTHGTGCTFAAAFTAYHLLTGSYKEAFLKSVALIDQLLQKSSACNIGHGIGGLVHHSFLDT